jgi:hypothetical protein
MGEDRGQGSRLDAAELLGAPGDVLRLRLVEEYATVYELAVRGELRSVRTGGGEYEAELARDLGTATRCLRAIGELCGVTPARPRAAIPEQRLTTEEAARRLRQLRATYPDGRPTARRHDA